MISSKYHIHIIYITYIEQDSIDSIVVVCSFVRSVISY